METEKEQYFEDVQDAIEALCRIVKAGSDFAPTYQDAIEALELELEDETLVIGANLFARMLKDETTN